MAASLLVSGCGKLVRDELISMQNEIDLIQNQVAQMNESLSSLRGIVEQMAAGGFVVDVKDFKDEDQRGGYTLVFNDGTELKLYSGVDGKDGQDAYGPALSIAKDEDGRWCWTLDGEFVTTEDGQHCSVDGKDGVTPQLKIDEEGYWCISLDNGETWEEILIPAWSTGKDWNYVPSGDISLKKFAGNLIKVKFQYNSTADAYATWEIKNLKVVEGEPVITTVAGLIDNTVAAETAFTGTFTDAVVSYVNGNNAFIEDATGGIQLYKSGHGLTAGMKISGTVSGKVKLYNGFAELTDVDGSKATVTPGEAPAPTVKTLAALLGSYLRWQNCQVKIEGVKFTKALTADNRNGEISQGDKTLAAYSQVKGKVLMDGEGDLICWPTRYNATLQVGCWDSAHFTKK